MAQKANAQQGVLQEKAARRALQLATQYATDTVQEDGHWLGSMSSDATITAEWIFLLQSIGRVIDDKDRAAYQYHFLSSQQDDGSWAIAPQYPHGGNLSATIEAYLALKILGLSTDHAAMRRAREFVLENGGVEGMRIFTRFHLAMFGIIPWSAVPQMPPELILLPAWLPINIYKFSSWARITIVPFLLIRTREPVYALPNGCQADNDYLDELWCNPGNKSVPYSKGFLNLWFSDKIALLFLMVDWLLCLVCSIGFLPLRNWAVRLCISWILERQEASGDWAGIFPPMHLSIYALLLHGHSLDDEPVRRGLEALDRFCYQDDEHGKWMQPCVSPVWDTFLMVRGLSDSNDIDADDGLLTRALAWTRAKQILVKHGDWRVYRPQLVSGGFSFEYANTWYPDVDDTAAGILAFLKQDPSSLYSGHVLRAAIWILGMQNGDGGWAAFDVGNDALFLNSIPFSDMDSLCDPSSADIAGRVIEAFGLMLQLYSQSKSREHEEIFQRIKIACTRAIGYLQSTQESTGAWYGRWGTNYVYGTSNVLCGLSYFVTTSRVRTMIKDAVQWLGSVQNADGGWGERLDSYTCPERAGVGESTPSQTAWALMGLLPINKVCRQFGRPQYNMVTYWRDFFRGLWDMRSMLTERYQENPENPFVIPTFHFGPTILIPSRLNPELRNVRESELNALMVHDKFLQKWHTLPDPTWTFKPAKMYWAAFRGVLNRSIDADVSTTASEAAKICDEVLSKRSIRKDSESEPLCDRWDEMYIKEVMMKIVTKNVSRLYVGKDLASDDNYISCLLGVLNGVLASVWIVNMTPDAIKPLVRLMSCLPIWLRKRKLDRLYYNKLLTEKKLQVEKGEKVDIHDDFATSLTAKAKRMPDKRFYELSNMSSRMLAQHFAAVHSTGTVSFRLCQKLMAHPELADKLRQEARVTLTQPENPEAWTAGELSALRLHDCFIAETLRTEPLIYSTIRRTCVQEGGYTFSDGTYIPKGFDVGIPTDQVHHDARFWGSDPKIFNPDRWLRREDPVTYVENDFYGFGHGRHACVGRFFASRLMKIMLIHINFTYEMKLVPGQGEGHFGFGFMHAPVDLKVKLRRRELKNAYSEG
ncbi:hypothetical protein F5B20DRAFT_591291 [Whalleya microplaca]|nr:hypothetical protein F5B20DRAFT_591291 [Whalleya microplaca]